MNRDSRPSSQALDRVCFFGQYDPTYPRNAVLREGLTRLGVAVTDVRAAIPLGATPSLLPLTRSLAMTRALRVASAGARAIYLPEFNQALAPLAAWVARRNRVPLVVDFLISLYDTAVGDRGQSRLRPRSALLWTADRVSLTCADLALTDTHADQVFFQQQFGPALGAKLRTVYVGAPELLFRPQPARPSTGQDLEVLFIGTYIPFHGVEVILDAARLVRDEAIRFTLVGRGQTYARARQQAADGSSRKVVFHDPVPVQRLSALMRSADVVLGTFGVSDKALRVIPNKVWQALACARPLITGDSEAVREVLTPERNAILVPHGDGQALADALRRLAGDAALRARLSTNAAMLMTRYSSRKLAQHFLAHLALVT